MKASLWGSKYRHVYAFKTLLCILSFVSSYMLGNDCPKAGISNPWCLSPRALESEEVLLIQSEESRLKRLAEAAHILRGGTGEEEGLRTWGGGREALGCMREGMG